MRGGRPVPRGRTAVTRDRAPGPGRARLFVTTQRFLEHFGLERPQDLPPLDVLAPLPPPDAPEPLEGMGATASEPDASTTTDETATDEATDEAIDEAIDEAADPSTQSESDAAPASF